MDLEILNIASDTDNYKNIKDHTHISKLKNSICGDEMQIKLIIKNDKIIDFGYSGHYCIYCQASVSILSRISINNKKEKINKLCIDAKSYFDGNLEALNSKYLSLKKLFKKENFSKKECILLPFKTLEKIIKN